MNNKIQKRKDDVMGIFDLINKTQEATETFTKKLDAFANQSGSEQLETILKTIGSAKGISKKKPKEKQRKVAKKVVKNHKTPKPDVSIEGISKQILEARDNMRKNGFTHYKYIANHDACDVCRQLNKKAFPISQLKIGVNAPPMHDGCRCSIAAHCER